MQVSSKPRLNKGVVFLSSKHYLPISCIFVLILLVLWCLQATWFICAILLVVLLCLGVKRFRKIAFLFVVLILIVSGRYQLELIQQQHSLQSIQRQMNTTFTGIIQSRDLQNGKQRLTVRIVEASSEGVIGEQVRLHYPLFPGFAVGDEITFSCLLQVPEALDDFAYDRYLYSQGIRFVCDDARLLEFHHQPPRSWLGRGKLFMAETVYGLWPRPMSSLLAGILLGLREQFPEQTLQNFSRAGITHIIALSGYNITIVIVSLEQFLLYLGIPKRYRFYVIAVAVTIFTIFVGAAASITRAAIMGTLVFWAKFHSRNTSPLRVILFTAAIMSLLNPYVLLYDMGFQLSFLSTVGLVYLHDIVKRFFTWIPNVFSVQESFTTTLAATLATLPLILLRFERLSVVSPLANLLVLPVIPPLMALSGLAVLLDWLFPWIAYPVIYIADLGARYILFISNWTASFSWSSLDISLSLAWCIIIYVMMLVIIFYDKKKQNHPR